MKKILPLFVLLMAVAIVLPACSDDDEDYESIYKEWHDQNDAWLAQMKARTNPDGTPYYQLIVPSWYPSGYVLIHYFNDRAQTEGNLSPLFTSVVDVIYRGYDCEDVPFDSSMTQNAYGHPGVQRFRCNGTINGWIAALEEMRVGDTAEVIIPYEMAYGVTGYNTIKPFSNLRFNMRLHDIYRYEASPY